MRRNSILLLLLLVSVHAFAQRPNILLIIADDVGLDPVPNYLPGPQKAHMPNLEALMANGLTFDNVWANPLCSPTRATMLTGRYGVHTGVLNANTESLLPSTEITLHRYLTNINSGYASSVIGKWHLGGPAGYPNFMGVPYYAGLTAGAVADYYEWTLTQNGTQTPRTDYITTAITDLGIDWIDQQTEPWFCWLAYTAPHVPFHLPPQNLHTQGALPTDQASIDTDPLPYYLAMLESVDFEIGRLLATIPEDELANTVIIFIGDNGTDRNVIQQPYGINQSKGTLFQGGVNVPMVISGAGVARTNEREGALVNSSDLFATIVELTGNPLQTYYDSRSLVPMLGQAGQSVRDCLYSEVSDNTNGYANRDERYKLITHANGNQFFYDLLLDPYENDNLLAGMLSTEQQAGLDALTTDCNIFASTKEHGTHTFLLYPDPVSDWMSVELFRSRSSQYTIRSISGAELAKGTVNDMGTIEVSGLPNGMFVLEIGGARRRFVKN